jgi:hypothetical protein
MCGAKEKKQKERLHFSKKRKMKGRSRWNGGEYLEFLSYFFKKQKCFLAANQR